MGRAMNHFHGLAAPAAADAAQSAELEQTLTVIESRLADLGDALRRRDSQSIEDHAAALHRALAAAIDRFSRAAQRGDVPPGLRHRLAHASGQVAAQRESLARATAALDRAIDVLIPRDSGAVYGSQGSADRAVRSGSMSA